MRGTWVSSESSPLTLVDRVPAVTIVITVMKTWQISYLRRQTPDDRSDISSPFTVLSSQLLKGLAWNLHPIRMMSPTTNSSNGIHGFPPSTESTAGP